MSFFKKKEKPEQLSSQKSRLFDLFSKAQSGQLLESAFSPEHTRPSETDDPPELSTLLKTATPSQGGLYPHEIIMLDYAHTYKTSGNRFQSFWYYQYSVTDPQAILDSLFERGFIERGDLRSALEKLKVSEIKEELKLLNEKVSGKKSDLIDRLLVAADTNILEKKYSERYYQLTPKGEQELKENQYVPYLHRHRYMNVWKMNYELAHDYKGRPYGDVIWGYFNQKSGEYFRNFDLGLYRNVRFSMYRFLMEKKEPPTGFVLLCEVAAYDLSVTNNGMKPFFETDPLENPKFYLYLYEMMIDHIAPHESSFVALSPAVIRWLAEYQTALNLSDEEFKAALLQEFRHCRPPFRVFTDEECAEIVIAEINHNEEYLESVYKLADRREQSKLAALRRNQ